ncbi:alpha-amylase family glycosyl hydrolase [Nonomuraea dietziae]|uniref:alpha-amylase family glycosyl hydrolase n=1 Tax=Nonomuraea dietziae TaxID=65515 RepID=UPI003383ADE0
MRLTYTSDLWYKNAVIYCLDVETYKDGNGDGVGDFRGLTQQIDYLRSLGITCLWLMPFFPTPNKDDGYDITDFYSIDPRLGTLGDFVEFMRTAKDRGIRVIADLVVNHTSDQHPWFKESRSSKDSPLRDWYVWSDKPEPDDPSQIVFPDKENSIWQLDKKTGQYYLHSFYRHQPDLNVANPEVRDEIARVLGFWMELGPVGVQGGRGAVPHRERRRQAAGPARLPGRSARLHEQARGRGGPAGRGQHALQGPRRLLRRRQRRPAHDVLRLHRHAARLAGLRQERGGADQPDAGRQTEAAQGLPVGDLPAQP